MEGRILVHGQDEFYGRSYLMLEGTDAKVHVIQYSPEMEQARHRGALRTNSFVRIRRNFDAGEPHLEAENFGNSEDLLLNRRLIADVAQQFINRGIVPTEDGWGGWLGRYQAALRQSTLELAHNVERVHTEKPRERQRSRNRMVGR